METFLNEVQQKRRSLEKDSQMQDNMAGMLSSLELQEVAEKQTGLEGSKKVLLEAREAFDRYAPEVDKLVQKENLRLDIPTNPDDIDGWINNVVDIKTRFEQQSKGLTQIKYNISRNVEPTFRRRVDGKKELK